MKTLNNIRYSLADAEEISKSFQNKKHKPSVRKLKKFEDTTSLQRNKSSKHKRNKRQNETFNEGNL